MYWEYKYELQHHDDREESVLLHELDREHAAGTREAQVSDKHMGPRGIWASKVRVRPFQRQGFSLRVVRQRPRAASDSSRNIEGDITSPVQECARAKEAPQPKG